MATPSWVSFYARGTGRPRSLILVNKNIKSDSYRQAKVDSRNVTSLIFKFPQVSLQICSIYNKPGTNEHYDELSRHLFLNPPEHPMLWHGDFNKRVWAGNNLPASTPADEAMALLQLLAEYGLDLVLRAGTLTHESAAHKTWNTLDLVFTSSDISDSVIFCDTLPDLRLPKSDHLPILEILDFELLRVPDTPKPNFRAVDWDKFNKALAVSLAADPISTDINSSDDDDTTYFALDKLLQHTIATHVPRFKSSPYAKR
ncbi:Endonuclease/exonuclease/phosphatase [Favolaschia claudopus]|uniref:Endonuclease/exonuclease/phosphatase n=1 Tax=Favolaschia claudopus TaxID=2862362 RepID=A0AAW0AS62_9AGAR